MLMGGAVMEQAEPPGIPSRSVLPNVGNPTMAHLRYAEELHAALPEELKSAAHDPLGAVALIYALLLSPDENIRRTQVAELARRADASVFEKITPLFSRVDAAVIAARLPLVNIALGALRHLSVEQFNQFSATLNWLIGSDGKIELFEFVLQKAVLRHLAPRFGAARPMAVQYYTLKPLVPDCAVILSALAHVGSGDAAEIANAFATGAPYLRAPAGINLALLPIQQCGVDQLGPALVRLALAAPVIKKNLLDACAYVVGADGVIVVAEAELLRAVADTLDCPLPPFIASAA
jgi:hypothetical protein